MNQEIPSLAFNRLYAPPPREIYPSWTWSQNLGYETGVFVGHREKNKRMAIEIEPSSLQTEPSSLQIAPSNADPIAPLHELSTAFEAYRQAFRRMFLRAKQTQPARVERLIQESLASPNLWCEVATFPISTDETASTEPLARLRAENAQLRDSLEALREQTDSNLEETRAVMIRAEEWVEELKALQKENAELRDVLDVKYPAKTLLLCSTGASIAFASSVMAWLCSGVVLIHAVLAIPLLVGSVAFSILAYRRMKAHGNCSVGANPPWHNDEEI